MMKDSQKRNMINMTMESMEHKKGGHNVIRSQL